jgi:DNA polymerase III alpha subunit
VSWLDRTHSPTRRGSVGGRSYGARRARPGVLVADRHEVDTGLRRPFPGGAPDGYAERAAYEIDVICDKGFPSYFLIVADLINRARSVDIRVAVA